MVLIEMNVVNRQSGESSPNYLKSSASLSDRLFGRVYTIRDGDERSYIDIAKYVETENLNIDYKTAKKMFAAVQNKLMQYSSQDTNFTYVDGLFREELKKNKP